jgi:hypothetical protein
MAPVLVPVLEVPTDPFQPSDPVPPLAVHEVAPLLLQASDATDPVCSVEGVAVKELTVAAGGGAVTFRATEVGELVPPGPAQVKV